MQIIIPMAGLGQRFVREGYKDPKPLLPIDGKPAIEHIVGLFPGNHSFTFICNSKHLKETKMREILNRIKPGSKIVEIEPHPLGPVHTVLKAKDEIRDQEPALVCYCDIFINWSFQDFQNHIDQNNHDACLICFKGFHPPLIREGFYAGVKEGKNLIAEAVKEKFCFAPKKTEGWNSAGVHYFKSGELMKKYLQRLVDLNLRTNNEFYISSVHDLMIQDGLQNGIYPVDHFISWGNPQDLREYLYWSKHFNEQADEN